MRVILIVLLSLLGACAPQRSVNVSHTARFPIYPTALYEAFEAVCSEPAQTFSHPAPAIRECREFLSPESTAAIILRYDGTTDNLPTLVVRMTQLPDDTGFLVKFESYLNVPQKSGEPIHLIHSSAAYDRNVAALLRLAGGVPQ